MAESAATARSRQEALDEILAPAARIKATPQQKQVAQEADARFASIQQNPFYSVVFDPNTSPEEKSKVMTSLLTNTSSKEQNRENVKAFDLFREYLQSVREQMATEIIKLSDTKNFALLRDTYQEINDALNKFETDIAPLTETLDALYTLRANGKTEEALTDIGTDKIREAEIKARKAEVEKKVSETESKINSINEQIAILNTKKSLWGLGGLTKEAIEQKAVKTVQLTQAISDLDLASADAKKIVDAGLKTTSNDAQYDEAKRVLREMLDISSPDHIKRSEELIKSAIGFVETSKQKIGQVREHLGGLDAQINQLSDNNGNMTYIHAMMSDAVKAAEVINENERQTISVVPETEGALDKLTRESKKRDLDEHIGFLNASAMDITATVADLTTASIRIKNMQDANVNQITQARDMQARGVAGVADRISTVIQAVGAAAIGEASNMTAESLNKISASTNNIVQKESMRQALGINDQNKAALKVIADLEQYGTVNEAAMKVTKAGLAEARANLEEMERVAQEVAKGVQESYGMAADAVASIKSGAGTGTIKVPSAASTPFPSFKIAK